MLKHFSWSQRHQPWGLLRVKAVRILLVQILQRRFVPNARTSRMSSLNLVENLESELPSAELFRTSPTRSGKPGKSFRHAWRMKVRFYPILNVMLLEFVFTSMSNSKYRLWLNCVCTIILLLGPSWHSDVVMYCPLACKIISNLLCPVLLSQRSASWGGTSNGLCPAVCNSLAWSSPDGLF